MQINGSNIISIDRLAGGKGTAVIAAATAGSATAVSALIGAANHQYAAAADAATISVAASVAVTGLLVPPITARWEAHIADDKHPVRRRHLTDG